MAAGEQRGPLWFDHPNYIHCRSGHLFTFHRSDVAVNWDRMTGHSFMACQRCRPTSYFLSVFTPKPDPFVLSFTLSREQYQHWCGAGRGYELEGGTLELLALLGYHSHYTPRQ